MASEILLEMIDVAKAYGPRLLFSNLSLRIASGEGILLTGANGSGKSSLLRLAAGLSKPMAGTIRRRGKTAFLSHATFLYPGLTALENLAFWRGADSENAEGMVLEEALDLVGLAPRAHDQVRHFSRGMSQRLNFARVLAADADIYLLDEPFSGLDQNSAQVIMDELLRRKKAGAALFTISHDPERDAALADNMYLLAEKRLTRLKSRDQACASP